MNRGWTASLSVVVAVAAAACASRPGLVDPGKRAPIFKDVKPPQLAPWDKAAPPKLDDKQIFLMFPDDKRERWSAVVCDCASARITYGAIVDEGDLAAFLRPIDKVILVDVPRRPPPPPPDGDDDFRAMAEAACAANPGIVTEIGKIKQRPVR